MLGEATMAEPWEGVGKATMAETHKAQEWASGWVWFSHWRWNLSVYVQASGNYWKSL
jgi:hypothetical protein